MSNAESNDNARGIIVIFPLHRLDTPVEAPAYTALNNGITAALTIRFFVEPPGYIAMNKLIIA
jgi:hypothetical protein